jgi:hypothetical protein
LQKVIKNSSCSIEINDFNLGENCESPQFKVTSYSTKDARLITESAAQLEMQKWKTSSNSFLFSSKKEYILF